VNDAAIRAVIVDDEPLAREAIRTFLEDDAEIRVVGEAADGRDAVELIRLEHPDLLFLDVQMPEMGGFEVLRELADEIPPAVVFVTAHDEHALRAFEVHALDYLLKPFGPERMATALRHAKRQLAADRLIGQATLRRLPGGGTSGESPSALEELDSEQTDVPTRLGVRTGSRVVLVEVASVDWIGGDGDYVRLHTGDDEHLLGATMAEMEDRLGPAGFVRVHRSTIVNIDRVGAFERDPDGGGIVTLKDGVQLRVSEGRWASFTRALGLET